ncbi:MAG: EAL domain-containing protein [Oscillospiraceae bacterium]
MSWKKTIVVVTLLFLLAGVALLCILPHRNLAIEKTVEHSDRILTSRFNVQRSIAGEKSMERGRNHHIGYEPCFVSGSIGANGAVQGTLVGVSGKQRFQEVLTAEACGGHATFSFCNAKGARVMGSASPLERFRGGNVLSGFRQGEALPSFGADKVASEWSVRKRQYLALQPLPINDWLMLSSMPDQLVAESIRAQVSPAFWLLSIVLICMLTVFLVCILMADHTHTKLLREREQLRISEAQYRIAAQQSGKYVLRYDVLSDVFLLDNEIANILKMPRSICEVSQSDFSQGNIAPESHADFSAFLASMRQGKRSGSVVLQMQNDSNAPSWFRGDFTTMFDSRQQPIQAVVTFYDATEQREQAIAYEKWKQEIASMPSDKTAVLECNLSRDLIESESGELVTLSRGLACASFDARTTAYADQHVYEAECLAYRTLLNRKNLISAFHKNLRTHALDYRELRGDGSVHWMRLSVQLVLYPDSQDIKAYLIIRDIDVEKRETIALLARSQEDPLTHVLNRFTLIDHMNKVFASSDGTAHHAVVMIDLDNFKQVNDSLGHAAGDHVLLLVVDALKTLLRAGDLMGRLGGDELMLCLRSMPYDDLIEKRAQLICQLICIPVSQDVSISGSIGIAMYPRDGLTFDDLYRKADIALYRAKALGRSQYLFYHVGMEAEGESLVTTPIDEAAWTRENERCPQGKLLFKQNQPLLKQQDETEHDLVRVRSMHPVLFSWNVETGDTYAGEGFSDYKLSKQLIPDIFCNRVDPTALHPDDQTLFCDSLASRKKTHSPRVAFTIRLNKTDGSWESCRLSMVYYSKDGVLSRAVGMLVPTSAAQQSSAIQLDALLRYMEGGVILFAVGREADVRTLYVSPGFYESFSRSPEEIGEQGHNLIRMVHKEDWPSLLEAIHRGIEADALIDQRYRVYQENNVVGWRRFRAIHIPYEGSSLPVILAMITDITRIKEQEQKLLWESEQRVYLSEHDLLTGLLNRHTFLENAERLIANKPPRSYCMAVMDIDNFKVVNDMLGHKEGDRLLCHLSEQLQKGMDKIGGICCRIHADMFAALQPYDPVLLQAFAQARNRVLHECRLPIELTSSTGRYVIDDLAVPASLMLDRAAIARKSLKGRYGCRDIYYNDEMRNAILQEQEIVGEMESALQSGQFDIYLQPQFSHATGQITGAEALVRWIHPIKGVLPPNVFIPIFERNGFISILDEYVWDRTCACLKQWSDEGQCIVPLSVNISRFDIYHSNLSEIIGQIVQKHGILPSQLNLEITESAYVENPAQLIASIKRLQAMGFVIEMDDFGSGYSSLNALSDVPVDILKLDMQFLMNQDSTGRREVLLQSVVEMATQMGLGLIAEGVETQEQADYLLQLGCEIMQGYYFSRPISVPEFRRLLSKQH